MKRKRLKSFVIRGLCVSMLFSLNTCKDSDTPSYECTTDITVLLPEKAVSTFFFKEGSYWIYQREDSLYTDSVWVTSAHQDILPVNKKVYNYFKGEKCYQSRSTFFTSKNGYFFISSKYSLQIKAPENTSLYSEEVFVLYETPSLNSGNSPQERILFRGNDLVKSNGFGDTTILLDSFAVVDTVLPNAMLFRKNASFPDYLKEAYYAPGFGLIRFNDKDDAWWNLVRYNIVQ